MVSRSRRQRAAIWVAAVSVLGLVSAGCSSGDDTGSTATSGASGGSGAQTGAAGAVDITLQEYAITQGCILIARTEPGEKYQAPDGGWQTRGSGAPQLHPRCPT